MGIADKYELISIIGYFACAIFLIIGIILFFTFRIRKVICDLSGITEKRGINRINEENSAKVNVSQLDFKTPNSISTTDKIITEGLAEKNKKKKRVLRNVEETTLLSNSETVLLSQENNKAQQDKNETTLLKNFTIMESIVIVNSEIMISKI